MANSKNRRYGEAVRGEFFFPVGSGKGGVGKSLITANLGMALATLLPEKRILLLDADLGIGNLHLFLGIRHPKLTLNDFLGRTVSSLSEIIEETDFENLGFISGANGVFSIANCNYKQKVRLTNALKSLPSDILFLDLSPGCNYKTIDFFNLSTRSILVTTPEPTSVQATYLFLRSAVYRKLNRAFKKDASILNLLKDASIRNSQDHGLPIKQLMIRVRMEDPVAAQRFEMMIESFHPYLILNMIQRRKQEKIWRRFQEVVEKYLAIELRFIGAIPFDKKVMRAVRAKEPLIITEPRSSAVKAIFNIADRLLHYERLNYRRQGK